MKTALVLGAGGFIGSHMVKRLRSEGYWVRGVDLKEPEFSETEANEFVYMDLRDPDIMRRVIRYGGETGNFYSSIVDKFLQPFDELVVAVYGAGGDDEFRLTEILEERLAGLKGFLGALSRSGFGLVQKIRFVNTNEFATPKK